jgi:uncharacterized protein YqhQ
MLITMLSCICLGITRKEVLAKFILVVVPVFMVRFHFSLTPKVINRMCTTTPVVAKMEH